MHAVKIEFKLDEFEITDAIDIHVLNTITPTKDKFVNVSKVIQNCTYFALLCSLIGPENLHH